MVYHLTLAVWICYRTAKKYRFQSLKYMFHTLFKWTHSKIFMKLTLWNSPRYQQIKTNTQLS